MGKMLKSSLKAVLVATIIVAAVFAYALWKFNQQPEYGGDFALTYQGQPWQFSADAKKLNLLYFGYVKCPDVCPMTLSYAGDAFKKLSADQAMMARFIFVSVDFAHDSPKSVADYATNFFPNFLGLSGSQQQIDKTIALFPASYMVEDNPKSYLGYSIIHTDKIFFLNKQGKVIDFVASPRDSQQILDKIKEHL
jgi:protein SCO1/2